MEKGASFLLGKHDFSAFCNELSLSKKDPFCTLSSIKILPLENNRFCFQVKGDRFLFRMVRNLVGTLAYIGCGKLLAENVPLLLQHRKRELVGMTAPCHGLHLIKVFY